MILVQISQWPITHIFVTAFGIIFISTKARVREYNDTSFVVIFGYGDHRNIFSLGRIAVDIQE